MSENVKKHKENTPDHFIPIELENKKKNPRGGKFAVSPFSPRQENFHTNYTRKRFPLLCDKYTPIHINIVLLNHELFLDKSVYIVIK